MTVKGVLEKVAPDKLKRIHGSYILAVGKVSSIQNQKAKLTSFAELPISDSYSGFIDE